MTTMTVAVQVGIERGVEERSKGSFVDPEVDVRFGPLRSLRCG